MGSDGDPAFDAYDPAVAYNSADEEYLVVWQGDDGVDDELEIYGQRLDASGAEVGPNDFCLSDMGLDGTPAFDALNPALVYNPAQNEYLVVWHGDDGPDNVVEIYGQRLDASGAEVGPNDFSISDMGASGTDSRFRAQDAAIAYNSADDEYLVVWEGDDDTPPLQDDEMEIYGQRLAADGGQVGPNDFRLSDMGPDGNTAYAADNPAVTYNSLANTYLVVWSGDDDRDFGDGPLADGELEVFGQRLAADGSQTGDNDFRISHMGSDGDPAFKTFGVEALYMASLDEYLVVWRADDDRDFGGGPLADDEMEIFGQWLAGATGAPLDEEDLRLSDAGNSDGDPSFDADRVALAAQSSGGSALVVWQADDQIDSLVPDEVEIMGRQLANPRAVDLAIAKSVAPDLALPGQTITYTLVFSNVGSNPAGGVLITDMVPISLTNVSVVSSGLSITNTGASPAYVWAVQALTGAQRGMITVSGQLAPCLPAGAFSNTATIATADQDAGTGNNSATAAVMVDNAPPVAVDDTGTTPENTPLTIDVLANDQDANCDVLSVSTIGAPGNGTAAISGTTQVVYTPNLSFNGTDSFTYQSHDGFAGSNAATVTVTVLLADQIDLAMDKEVDDPTPNEGATLVYTLTVSNHGPADASGIVAYDPLPVSLTYVSDDGGGDYDPGSGVWTVGSVPADDNARLHISAQVDVGTDGTTITNTASITASDQEDPAPGNDQDEVAITVSGTPPSCTEVSAVALSYTNAGAIYTSTAVHFVSDISPNDFSGPYSYTLDYGDGTTPISGASSDDPLLLEHTYAITGNWVAQIEVWNCQMAERIVDTVQVLVVELAYDIYLPIVIKTGQ